MTSGVRPTPSDDAWQRVIDVADGELARWSALHAGMWAIVDPRILELCRLRIATLLGATRHAELRSPAARELGVTEELVAELPGWPTSPRFTSRDRACLALTEQFVMDVSGVDQQLVDSVLEHLTPGECYSFVNAIWAAEALQRTCLVLGTTPEPAALGLVHVDGDPAGGPS